MMRYNKTDKMNSTIKSIISTSSGSDITVFDNTIIILHNRWY